MGAATCILRHARRRRRQTLGEPEYLGPCVAPTTIFQCVDRKGSRNFKRFRRKQPQTELPFPGRVEHIWAWLSEHRDQVEGYAVVDDMDLSLDSTGHGQSIGLHHISISCRRAQHFLCAGSTVMCAMSGVRTQPSCIAAHFVRTPSAVGREASARSNHNLAQTDHPCLLGQDSHLATCHGSSPSCRKSRPCQRPWA